MSTKKMQRKSKKMRTLRRTYKKGGCGSCNSSRSFLIGGSSASLDQVINHNPAVIPYNQNQGSSMDPSDSSNMVSVRMQPNIISGGKKLYKKLKKKKGNTRKLKKLRGGSADPSTINAISSFGTTYGLSSVYTTLAGSQTVDPSITNQPIGNASYGTHNKALI
jgi:NADH:ubiquinone oxidoreductase subunit F (NADH-binding)